MVDSKETNLVHRWQLGNEVDDGGDQVDKEGERSVVSVMGAEQEPVSEKRVDPRIKLEYGVG